MRIALIGYGTMGKAIEAIALAEGDEIVLKIDQHNAELLQSDALKNADVAIEFSQPDVAQRNILSCIDANVPVVSGTTGWLAGMPMVKQRVQDQQGAFLYASNFSIGVNILFAVNTYLARLMNKQSQYDVALHEVHHTRKKDAPSGTALRLARNIVEQIDRKSAWHYLEEPETDKLFVSASRLGDTPGTHTIRYRSRVDEIGLVHRAYSREGFARGALLAARWLPGKTGLFSMQDVLGIDTK